MDNSSKNSSTTSSKNTTFISTVEQFNGEQTYYGAPEDHDIYSPYEPEPEPEKHIKVGDYLPYGPRLYYNSTETIVRMKDFGENSRIMILGVLGSFTPDCWNRHLFLVLKNLRYYEERNVDYICCVSTNDAYVQKCWGEFLCCEDDIFMLSDATTRFTKAMGMEIVLPWLDDTVRSRRYVILAEDMLVTKMIMSNSDDPFLEWQCEHIQNREAGDDDDQSDSDPWNV